MKAVVINQPGQEAQLTYTTVPNPTLAADDLLIKVYATALNRVDIIQKEAIFTPAAHASTIPGIEVAGEIVEKGENVKHWQVGDRVFGFVNGGGYAQYCLLDQYMALPIPDHWDYAYAAAIPEVFITAAERLFTNGDLKAQQTILIHAGGSGVGTAAIQLAKYAQARIFITAGSDEKVQRCLALGAEIGINYKKEDFVQVVLQATAQQGVELILDSIGPAYLMRNMEALKPDGKLIIMGVLSGTMGQFDMVQFIYKRLQMIANNLTRRSLVSQREVNERFRKHIFPLLTAEKIKPIIDSIFPIEEVVKAQQRMEENHNFGKIILSVSHT